VWNRRRRRDAAITKQMPAPSPIHPAISPRSWFAGGWALMAWSAGGTADAGAIWTEVAAISRGAAKPAIVMARAHLQKNSRTGFELLRIDTPAPERHLRS